MKLEQTLSINDWITNCIDGSEEFESYKEYRADTNESLAANWIIQSLMDTQLEGSEEILQLIVATRNEMNSK